MILVAMTVATPTVDPRTICQSARAAVLDQDKSASFDSCVRDETAARDQDPSTLGPVLGGRAVDLRAAGGRHAELCRSADLSRMESGSGLGGKIEQPSSSTRSRRFAGGGLKNPTTRP